MCLYCTYLVIGAWICAASKPAGFGGWRRTCHLSPENTHTLSNTWITTAGTHIALTLYTHIADNIVVVLISIEEQINNCFPPEHTRLHSSDAQRWTPQPGIENHWWEFIWWANNSIWCTEQAEKYAMPPSDPPFSLFRKDNFPTLLFGQFWAVLGHFGFLLEPPKGVFPLW